MKKILALILALVMVMALCACGAKEEAPAEAPAAEAPAAEAPAAEAPAAEAPAAEAPAAEAPAVEGDASGEMGGATGEMPQLNTTGEFEITVGGVTDVAQYADTDSGDQETKTFVVTWQGTEMTGTIDKGVWTADDAANQEVISAVQAAFESNNAVGPASGEPSEEPAA